MNGKNIALIGANGAIGQALLAQLASDATHTLHAFSRAPSNQRLPNVHYHTMDYLDEQQLQQGANLACQLGPLDRVIIAIGLLHNETCYPEKSLSQISRTNFEAMFLANAIAPALIAKYFLPKMRHLERVVFAVLSARIGSISDNRLGGWYGYRSAKAALNMIIKNAAIEMSRSHKKAIVIGLHPGTVDSPLSKPFQKHVPKLLTPQACAQNLLHVIEHCSVQDSGCCLASDNQIIAP